jgi:hypothetical protein
MRAWLFLAAVLLAQGCSTSSSTAPVGDDVFSLEVFADPPASFGPQARWWWPGGSVDDETLRDQLRELRELGYGAVEIQPFMAALTNADLRQNARIRTVGEASFLSSLAVTACAAHDNGLPWDLTLGSGWSTGGPEVGDDGARQLIAAEQTLEGPESYTGPLPEAEPPDWIDTTNGLLPAIDGFDEDTVLTSVLAAPILEEPEEAPAVLGEIIDLSENVEGSTLTWDVPEGLHRVFAIYENRTQHYPFGNAYATPLEQARVIDHLDRRGVVGFLERQFEAWVDATGDCPPRAVFIDSFELVAELPWTTVFGEQFEADVGYGITPFLPFLFLEGGESEYVNIFGEPPPRYRAADERGARAREDYEAFRGARFTEELVKVVDAWAETRDLELRLQAHGGYADALDAYATSDVPESEGLYAGGSYDFLRLAASAAEVSGKRYTSSETLVTVGARELTVDEARLLFGRAFSAGINRLMLHGHAYPYTHTDGVRWFPFHPREDSAATAGPADLSFDLNPAASIWSDLPTLNRMAARVGYAMSRGTVETEVAWLYPEWKVPNRPNFGVEPGAFESETSRAVRAAGFGYTRVSRNALRDATAAGGTLRVGEASFDALLITDLPPVDPRVLQAVQAAADAGVPVIWLGDFPSRADGLVDAAVRDAEVATWVERLQSSVTVVDVATEIAPTLLQAGVSPSLVPATSSGTRLSVARRRVAGGDVYYIFNESFEARTEQLRIAERFSSAMLLDPETGEELSAALEGEIVTVTLGPARGIVLVITSS